MHHRISNYEAMYTNMQEELRKDVERRFGVLQSRWEIVRGENRLWDKEEVLILSEACVIIYSILVTMVHSGSLDGDGKEITIGEIYEEYLDGLVVLDEIDDGDEKV